MERDICRDNDYDMSIYTAIFLHGEGWEGRGHPHGQLAVQSCTARNLIGPAVDLHSGVL